MAEGSLEEDDDSDKDETAPETSSDDLKNVCFFKVLKINIFLTYFVQFVKKVLIVKTTNYI